VEIIEPRSERKVRAKISAPRVRAASRRSAREHHGGDGELQTGDEEVLALGGGFRQPDIELWNSGIRKRKMAFGVFPDFLSPKFFALVTPPMILLGINIDHCATVRQPATGRPRATSGDAVEPIGCPGRPGGAAPVPTASPSPAEDRRHIRSATSGGCARPSPRASTSRCLHAGDDRSRSS